MPEVKVEVDEIESEEEPVVGTMDAIMVTATAAYGDTKANVNVDCDILDTQRDSNDEVEMECDNLNYLDCDSDEEAEESNTTKNTSKNLEEKSKRLKKLKIDVEQVCIVLVFFF